MVVHARYPVGETRVEREARALLEQGYEVDVVCLRDQGETAADVINGVRVHRLPVRRHRNRGLLWQFWEYFSFFVLALVKLNALDRRSRYGTIQVHNPPDFLVFAAALPKLRGARVILDLHDLLPEFYAARSGRSLQSAPVRFVRWLERVACGYADHVITVTELWRQTLIGRGLPPEKVSVMMNVADPSIFHRGGCPASVTRVERRFCIIYHGNLTLRYGLDILLRAGARLRNRIPDVHLLIHGSGPLLSALRNEVRTLGIEENATFSTRKLLTSELPSLIALADVGVVPYRQDVFTDGVLPTKVMEYVALGLPVIAARTSAMRMYFDEDMIMFFPPGDDEALAECLWTLYADPTRRERLARCSGAFLSRYCWTAQSRAYLDVLTHLLSPGER